MSKITLQENKLIVEFLGGRQVDSIRSGGQDYEMFDLPASFPIYLSEPDIFGMKRTGYLGFDKQWDWIMPVWEHFRYLVWENIGGYPPDFEVYKQSFLTAVFNSSITGARQILIYSIQWYNQKMSSGQKAQASVATEDHQGTEVGKQKP